MTQPHNPQSPSLADAPKEVQLAVDLIYLLETNGIAPELALAALEIVQADLQAKVAHASPAANQSATDE
ncbi:pleiotropic regulatory protein RsmS [Photobacterium sp. GJ3]|uniref:pleiotropic regulatory protein RsmS n=1 Tax=Photobacterium sp. GJ3 TaxID=2829502 RepID=UPI001B8B9A21|nr:pleiotropic regulatory protein RsmS [Photobacterium sp. GJ3]QUJ66573.1 pleiotropic regulatory protein RsmS [Photobacterium sp. GJ3]